MSQQGYKPMQSLKNRLSKWIFETDIFKEQAIYLVGGCVRDIILKRHAQDIDLCCANARQLAYALAKEKGAVCVVMDKKPNVPCFRLINRKFPEDYIDLTEIRDHVIESDLKQRDFTVNAMAIPLASGQFDPSMIIDIVDGQGDLKNKIIRQVSPNAFVDDPLRMLRAFRFSAQLDFSIDPKTIKNIHTHATKIKTVSSERILFELKLLFRVSNILTHIEAMDKTGLLSAIFPEIEALKNCDQNYYHHTTVWGHSLEALKAYENLLTQVKSLFKTTADQLMDFLNQDDHIALIKMACLFHDIAKPSTRNVDAETNRITFFKHDKAGRNEIEIICDRLRLSKKNSLFLCTLVEEHLHIRDLLKPGTRQKTILKSIRKLGEVIVAITLLSIADKQATRGVKSSSKDRQMYQDKAIQFIESYYNDIQPVICTKNLITGKHLMECGVKPGPVMGKLLRIVREAQDEGKISTPSEAIELAKEHFKNMEQV